LASTQLRVSERPGIAGPFLFCDRSPLLPCLRREAKEI
jgi:hypothetical protein